MVERVVRMPERWRQARACLAVDEVLTAGQLARRGVDASFLPHVDLSIRPMPRGSIEQDVRFHALSSARLRRPPGILTHAVGLAEMRQMQGIPPGAWRVTQSGRHHVPDGMADTPGGVQAFEFDAGYTSRIVQEKMRAFQRYDGGIVWGTPSALRAERLRSAYPDVTVLVVDYWSAGHT